MIIELRDLMLSDAGTVALVGDRIYPEEMPDAPSFPAIVLTLISERPDYTNDGDSQVDSTRVQLDIYAEGYEVATTVYNAVRSLLSGYRSPAGSGCVFQGIFVINGSDHEARETEKAGPKLRRRMLEISLWSNRNA